MRTYDLTPLFRSSVGFDRMSRLLDSARQLESTATSYPPYNIVKTGETAYQITLAVAGFAREDLEIETHEGRLKVTGTTEPEAEDIEFLHRGIAGRRFERTFQLADTVHVRGATLEHGLLHIQLERVIPEALKPRRIHIGGDEEAEEVAAK